MWEECGENVEGCGDDVGTGDLARPYLETDSYVPALITTALSFSNVIATGFPPFAYCKVRDP